VKESEDRITLQLESRRIDYKSIPIMAAGLAGLPTGLGMVFCTISLGREYTGKAK